MKYVVLQGDGMSDLPLASLGGETPLERARTPSLDRAAACGRLGLVRTIPSGFAAGTDVGTMSILGYDPARYHTGRSPIEAVSMGIELGPTDVAFRCNLVTIEQRDGHEVMADFTAGHIGSDEAREIVLTIQERLGNDQIRFYPGVSYRHLLVWHDGPTETKATPPHDITDQPVAPSSPRGEGSEHLAEIATAARTILAEHPVNRRRVARGEKAATDIWLWGQGRRPKMPTLQERFGLSGAVITAVDVVGGLGHLAGLKRVEVPGITGFIDTDYRAKARHALSTLEDLDFVFIHVEAPDECGHMGDAKLKIRAIEDLDAQVLGPILAGLERLGSWRVLVLPDHATPVSLKTHTDDLVPFAILDSRQRRRSNRVYSEKEAAATGDVVEQGHRLLAEFLA